MVLSDIIALLALLVSVTSLVLSWRTSNKHSELYGFYEFTRRFQEIVLHLYPDTKDKTYHKLYFDLCNEEFYMSENNKLPSDIWDSWISEMKIIMTEKDILESWQKLKDNYDEKFKEFFEKIITQSITNKN